MCKRALVSWDHLCLPQHAGGLDLTYIEWWNKAAVCKLLWCVAQKKDKKDRILVKWIRGYYIKDQIMLTMNIQSQCSWVIRKILQAGDALLESSAGAAGLGQNYFSVRKLYIDLGGEYAKVDWHRLLIDNVAPPKCHFIMWLAMLDRMVTCEYMRRLGFQGDDLCCFFEQESETMEHLFFLCPYILRREK